MSTMRKVAEVKASEVESWVLDKFKEFANSIDYSPLGEFLVATAQMLHNGKDVALYAIENNFPDSIDTKDD